jgi:hypothetical protein
LRLHFLAIGYAGCYQYPTALDAGLVELSLFLGHAGVNKRTEQAARGRADACAHQGRGERSGCHYGADAGDREGAYADKKSSEAAQHATADCARYSAASSPGVGDYLCTCCACGRPHGYSNISRGDAAGSKLLYGSLCLRSRVE